MFIKTVQTRNYEYCNQLSDIEGNTRNNMDTKTAKEIHYITISLK